MGEIGSDGEREKITGEENARQEKSSFLLGCSSNFMQSIADG